MILDVLFLIYKLLGEEPGLKNPCIKSTLFQRSTARVNNFYIIQHVNLYKMYNIHRIYLRYYN